jgi:hypothetical protein
MVPGVSASRSSRPMMKLVLQIAIAASA